MLSGQHFHNMDKKGRVFIPAKFREELGSRVVLCRSIDKKNCVCVYRSEDYQALIAKISEKPSKIKNPLFRYLSSSVEVEYDAQGRVNIPQNLRTPANLSDEEQLIIVGASEKVEIWTTSAWDEVNSEDLSDDILDLIDEAGI